MLSESAIVENWENVMTSGTMLLRVLAILLVLVETTSVPMVALGRTQLELEEMKLVFGPVI